MDVHHGGRSAYRRVSLRMSRAVEELEAHMDRADHLLGYRRYRSDDSWQRCWRAVSCLIAAAQDIDRSS